LLPQTIAGFKVPSSKGKEATGRGGEGKGKIEGKGREEKGRRKEGNERGWSK